MLMQRKAIEQFAERVLVQDCRFASYQGLKWMRENSSQ